MSSYGTAIILDLPEAALDVVREALREVSLAAGSRHRLPDGLVRIALYTDEIEIDDAVAQALAAAGAGRAALAEDNDDFGARWVVLTAAAGVVGTVHRRYVLNADPAAPEEVAAALEELDDDPRDRDVAGADAAAAAAAVFGVDPAPVVAAEAESASAWENLGVIGGPFPWWQPLGLTWPVPPPGEPLGW